MGKDQLAHIRKLIEQKRYADARQQLIPLSEQGHPIAQKWLAKLNEVAPPASSATNKAHIGAYLDAVEQQKTQRQQIEAAEKARRRRLGCLARGVMLLVVSFILLFVFGPMLLAAGIVSNNPQVNRTASQVMSFIEQQQNNAIGRTVTQIYAETSGRLTESIIVSNTDQICDLAIEQGAAQGMTVHRADCEDVVREASVCMTDQLTQAQQCLRRYVTNRCLQQVGNTPEARAYCADFVDEHMGRAG
jgi:hypothetical protein